MTCHLEGHAYAESKHGVCRFAGRIECFVPRAARVCCLLVCLFCLLVFGLFACLFICLFVCLCD